MRLFIFFTQQPHHNLKATQNLTILRIKPLILLRSLMSWCPHIFDMLIDCDDFVTTDSTAAAEPEK